jgi:hypothetical protein
MIVGHRNVGKRLVTAAIAVLLSMIALTALVAFRKKTAPEKVPPLHPSTLVMTRVSELILH